MKKLMYLLLAVLMVCAVFAGCSNAGKTDVDDDDDDQESEEVSEEVSETQGADVTLDIDIPTTSDIASTGSPAADSYLAYTTAKSTMLTKLTDGLGSNDQYALTSLALMGPMMMDLAFLPVSMSGLGEEAAAAGLGFFNAAGVHYSESGNTYTISYTSEEQDDQGNTVNVAYEFVSTYNPGTNGMVSTASRDGVPALYMEYHQTSFGWVGQYATPAEDGGNAFDIIYVSVQGEDGAIGIGQSATTPAPLTGSESVDFPTTLPTWFAVTGNTVTGLSDGEAIDFEYTPTPSA